eukprot:IDg9902t1
MRIPVISFAFIVALNGVANATGTSECVSAFNRDRERFRVCEEAPCFVFIGEEPVVFLDPAFVSDKQAYPFRCSDTNKYPRLGGYFFHFVRSVPTLSDSYCIWGGPKCTADKMVNFVAENSNSSKAQLIVGCNLFVLKYRIGEHTIPSISFNEGKVLVFGSSRDKRLTISTAIHVIVQPFEPFAWVLLSCVILGFIGTRILITLVYTRPLQPALFIRNYLACRFKVFVLIFVLFYELAVVNFIFNYHSDGQAHRVENLSINELKQYAVSKESAESHIFRRFVDPHDRFISKRPWTETENHTEVFKKILDPSHPARYGISFSDGARYELRKKNLCNKFDLYNTSVPLHQYSTVWYYGSNLPPKKRTAINQGISELREANKVSPAIDEAVGFMPQNCGKIESRIGPLILAVPLAMALAPFFFWTLFADLRPSIIIRKLGRVSMDSVVRVACSIAFFHGACTEKQIIPPLPYSNKCVL